MEHKESCFSQALLSMKHGRRHDTDTDTSTSIIIKKKKNK